MGTIEPLSQATIAFPVAGKVASVGVKVGDAVTVGEPLASLDTQSLKNTLDQKQAALAQAQLNLSKALSGQSVSGSTGSAGGSVASAQTSAARSGSTAQAVLMAAATSSDPTIAAAQQAVLAAQHRVDTALAAATAALTSAQNVCSGVSNPPPSTTTTPTSTTTSSTPTSTTTPSNGNLSACQTAIRNVLSAETAVANAQHALVDASNALDALLERAAATSGSGGGASQGSGGSNNGSTGAASSSSRSSSPSAADLASYQQAVDAAASQVAVAQQALSQAAIASPIDGTVVAVNLTVGSSVSSASSTANIVVQGGGGYEVSTTIGVDLIPHVAIGDSATVVPDGSHTALPGKVASISVAPASATTTTSYLVVIGLAKPQMALNNGATGTVTIVTQSARSALAVPTSAVTTTGTRHTVQVLSAGTTKQITVQVGVVGPTWTEIRSGLTKGEQVVLADVAQPLPGSATSSSNSNSTSSNTGFVGRFPGAGNLVPGQGR